MVLNWVIIYVPNFKPVVNFMPIFFGWFLLFFGGGKQFHSIVFFVLDSSLGLGLNFENIAVLVNIITLGGR